MHLVPAPAGTQYRVGFVCLGNICRSPMADVVMRAQAADAGLAHLIEVTSCGTGGWHVGGAMDSRAAATLSSAGYDPSGHLARQLDPGWLDRDLLLAMDSHNLAGLRNLGVGPEQGVLFRTFDPDAVDDLDVPDPYYGGDAGFVEVLAMIERTNAELLAQISSTMR